LVNLNFIVGSFVAKSADFAKKSDTLLNASSFLFINLVFFFACWIVYLWQQFLRS